MTTTIEAPTPVKRTQKENRLIKAAARARAETLSRDALIRELRGEGKSYRYLAELCGISHTQISNICRNGPSPD